MSDPLAELLSLLGIALIGLLIWAALSPFEALGWWAGWFGDKIYQEDGTSFLPAQSHYPNADLYVVFLSGISRVSGETFSRREQNFLKHLSQAMPKALVIDNIFPYSVNNLPLTGQPIFAGLWQWALRRKLSRHWLERLAGYLINLRNMWQVAISIDKRYGPIYNQAMAQVIINTLAHYGYDLDARRPILLVGYSGAGQIAVGTATYLKEEVGAPIFVISMGGIFGSDIGLLAADHVYHLYGSADRPQQLGKILFPGRWPFFFYSAWNRAVRMGRISEICLGPISHAGDTGYLTTSRKLPDGLSHLEKTVQTIASLPYESHTLRPDSDAPVATSLSLF
jgi:pimeloyl-ACP methyl ester carboxylesterase